MTHLAGRLCSRAHFAVGQGLLTVVCQGEQILKEPSEQSWDCAPPGLESACGPPSALGAVDAVVALLCAISILSFIGSREIQGVRERRIAGSAADIVRNGTWLLPSLRGEPRFRKPHLATWSAATSLKLLGRSEFAFRLPFALFGLGTVALSYFLARSLMGTTVARTTALILASSVVFVSECHLASTDLLLTFFCAAAMLSWIHWRKSGQPWTRSWWCFYLSISLAVLSKGPLALAFLAIPIGLELWASGHWAVLRRMRLVPGLLVVMAPLLLWVLAVCLRVENALGTWLRDIRLSFDNHDDGKWQEYFAHIGQWPWVCFPWSVAGLVALILPAIRRWVGDWTELRVCYFWLVGNIAFLCTWAMQPMHYLLPLVVPVSILEAALIHRAIAALRQGEVNVHLSRLAVVFSLCFLALAPLLATLLHVYADCAIWLAAVVAAIVGLPALVGVCRLHAAPARAFWCCTATSLACLFILAGWVQPRMTNPTSCAPFAKRLSAIVPASEPVYFLSMDDAVPFYANRDFRELDPSDESDLRTSLSAIGNGYLMLRRAKFDELADAARGMAAISILLENQRVPKQPKSLELLLVRLDPLVMAADSGEATRR